MLVGSSARVRSTFRSLVADADHVGVVVARFLALLELFRESAVAFEQVRSLGELTIRWTGNRRRRGGGEFDEVDLVEEANATSELQSTSRRGAIEAILMVVDEPVAPVDLAAALDVPEPEVLATLEALRDDYANPDAPRGFELRDIGGGWRIYSSPPLRRRRGRLHRRGPVRAAVAGGAGDPRGGRVPPAGDARAGVADPRR